MLTIIWGPHWRSPNWCLLHLFDFGWIKKDRTESVSITLCVITPDVGEAKVELRGGFVGLRY